jgi:fumarate reductase flavoprotein subunit
VRPAVHYTMGGIPTDVNGASPLPGLYAAGECASSGIHGANRLGSNSLAELLVFGRAAGEHAARHVRDASPANAATLRWQAQDSQARARSLLDHPGGSERLAVLRDEMARSMERSCGIYRLGEEMQETCRTLGELRQRLARVLLADRKPAWNTEWLGALELGFQLEVAQAMAHSALARRESRGAHQRLDEGCTLRDDASYLKHTYAWRMHDGAPRIGWGDVKITRSPPGLRVYGGAAARETAHA